MQESPDAVRPLPFTAPAAVVDAIAGLGRTEDLRFSPSNQRLALAVFHAGQIAVFDIRLSRLEVTLTGGALLTSPAFRQPHGLDFLDDETLVVANRAGEVVVIPLPPGQPEVPTVTVEARSICPGWEGPFEAPGSVLISPAPDDAFAVLVVDNNAHTVSRLSGARAPDRLEARAIEVVVSGYLDLPDGLAMSPDGQWLAVSNHNPHNVLLYRWSEAPKMAPDGILRGVRFPHGLRFTPDGGTIWVADAGMPHIHAYTQGPNGWAGVHEPESFCVMDDRTFAAGHCNPQEGGPKGLDVNNGGCILAVTSEHQPLAFFAVEALLQAGLDDARRSTIAVEHEVRLMADQRESNRNLQLARLALAEVKESRSWRLTAPLRRLRSWMETWLSQPKR